MENKYIIDKTTGTVLDLEGCYIINGDQLDDTFTDSEIADLADRAGRKPLDMADYTEADALSLVSYWAKQYGWKYAVFNRDDVRQTLVDMYGEIDTLDSHVARVMGTRMWIKTLEDAINREGMECVYDAVEMVKQGE